MITQYEFGFKLIQSEQGEMLNQPPENPNENWKVHPRFTSYEISDLGNVRDVYRKKLRSLIKKHKNISNSYLKVGINDPSFNKNYGFVSVHKLVAETWMGEEYDRSKEIHHIDGIRANNKLSNLQQLTRAEHKAAHIKIYGMFTKEGILVNILKGIDDIQANNLSIRCISSVVRGKNKTHKKHIFRKLTEFPEINEWKIGEKYEVNLRLS